MRYCAMILSAALFMSGCDLFTSSSDGTVTVRVEKNVLSIENATNTDVYQIVFESDLAALVDWIPFCDESYRIAPRSTKRIAFHDSTFLPSRRAIVYWWHKGAKYENSERYGADSLRSIGVPIP